MFASSILLLSLLLFEMTASNWGWFNSKGNKKGTRNGARKGTRKKKPSNGSPNNLKFFNLVGMKTGESKVILKNGPITVRGVCGDNKVSLIWTVMDKAQDLYLFGNLNDPPKHPNLLRAGKKYTERMWEGSRNSDGIYYKSVGGGAIATTSSFYVGHLDSVAANVIENGLLHGGNCDLAGFLLYAAPAPV